PPQAVAQGDVARYLPLVLCEQCEIFVRDIGEPGGIRCRAIQVCALQIEQQRRCRARQVVASRSAYPRSVGAAAGARAEAFLPVIGCIMQESHRIAEQVTALEESAEYLCVSAVDPLAADLIVVASLDDREIVLKLRAPEDLVHSRGKEEWVSKAECR